MINTIKDIALEFGYRIPRATNVLVASRKFSAMYVRLAPRNRDTEQVTHHVDILFADACLHDFEQALRNSIEIESGSGVRYANVLDLIEMKEQAVARPGRSHESILKDQSDIEFLKKLSEDLRKLPREPDRTN